MAWSMSEAADAVAGDPRRPAWRAADQCACIDADPAWLVRLPSDPQAQRGRGAGALATGGLERAARGGVRPVALPLFAVNAAMERH
jgi:hypothetical protein